MNLEFQDMIPKQFNFCYDTKIESDMTFHEVVEELDRAQVNYFYISLNWQDVITAICEEWEIAEQLGLELIHIVPNGVAVAVYL